MANYERRRYQDRDENDAEFYRQYRGRGSNPDYGYDRDYGYSGRDYDRGFRAGGNSDFYGQNMGSRGGSDYDRDYDRGFREGSNSDYSGRNMGSRGGSDYDRDYDNGYEGRGSSSMGGSNYQGRNMGSHNDWDYDRLMGGNQYSNQGRSSGYNRQYNQGQNWGSNQSNMQSGQWGEHYGRGPQGYKRSDDRIKEDVNDRLTWHGNVDATHIQVSVKDGEVTLEGTVSDRYQKRMAEETAEQVQGVSDVQNRLRVKNDTGDMNQSSTSKRSSSSQSSSMSPVPNGKPKERADS